MDALSPRRLRRTALPAKPSVKALLARIDALETAQAEANMAQDRLIKATTALRESEERYALAMRGPNEGLWDWNPVTKELYLSARLLQILGFSSVTLRTTSSEWLDLVHPDDRGHYQSTLIDHLKGNADHFECEYRVRDRQGTYRWVLARGLALRDETTGIAYRMAGSIGDITALKFRESVLRANESRFRSLVRAAASVILVIDGAGCIQEFNLEAERIFGIAAETAVGSHWSSVLGTSDRAFALLVQQALDGTETRDLETTLCAGEVCRVLSWNLTPFEGGAVAVGLDITRRKTAERDLQEINDQLEARVAERTRQLTAEVEERLKAELELLAAKDQAETASRCKSQFLANMSHELRTPLNAIIGFSDMMHSQVMGPLANPHYMDYARAILESGRHLLDIINDILDLAKIESGRFELHREPTDIAATIAAALRLVADRAAGAGVTLGCHIEPDLPPADIDPLRIKQVLLNLLSNAIKFTPSGGHISVSAARDAARLTIIVRDTGIGMDEDQLWSAMQPFMQVDSRLSRLYQGTGLGLPLAKYFVKLHGGQFDIASIPGTGTTVTLALP